jgi:LSD1 subclass zinc finger protein
MAGSVTQPQSQHTPHTHTQQHTHAQDTQQMHLSAPVVVSSGSGSSAVRTSPYTAGVTAAAPTQQSLLNAPAPPLNIAQIQQRQLQIQQQLQQNNQMQAQAQAQAQSGASTSNEQAVLKYVCCGSCRQWLSSPRDATFVYCPGQSVSQSAMPCCFIHCFLHQRNACIY